MLMEAYALFKTNRPVQKKIDENAMSRRQTSLWKSMNLKMDAC